MRPPRKDNILRWWLEDLRFHWRVLRCPIPEVPHEGPRTMLAVLWNLPRVLLCHWFGHKWEPDPDLHYPFWVCRRCGWGAF